MTPDNGLLGRMLDHAENPLIFRLDLGVLERLNITTPSNTFHGRDIFAPIAAELAAGRTTPVSLGTATQSWIPAWIDEPEVSDSKVSGSIITVDAFGNLISNIDSGHIAAFCGSDAENRLQILFREDRINGLSGVYSEAEPMRPLAVTDRLCRSQSVRSRARSEHRDWSRQTLSGSRR